MVILTDVLPDLRYKMTYPMLIIWTNNFFLIIKRNIIQGWCQVRNLYQNQMQTAHPITSDAKLSISCPESKDRILGIYGNTRKCQQNLYTILSRFFIP